jgi:hypothetical protein
MSLNNKILKYQSKLQSTIQTSPKYSSYMNKYMYYVSKNNNMRGGNYNCNSLKCIETNNGIHKTKEDCENNCNAQLVTLRADYMKLYNEMMAINYEDIQNKRNQIIDFLSTSNINCTNNNNNTDEINKLCKDAKISLSYYENIITNYNKNKIRLEELKKEYEEVFNFQQRMKNKREQWESQIKNDPVNKLIENARLEINNEQKGNYEDIIKNIRFKILKSNTLLAVFTDLDNLEKEALITLRLKKMKDVQLNEDEQKVIYSYLKFQDKCNI